MSSLNISTEESANKQIKIKIYERRNPDRKLTEFNIGLHEHGSVFYRRENLCDLSYENDNLWCVCKIHQATAQAGKNQFYTNTRETFPFC